MLRLLVALVTVTAALALAACGDDESGGDGGSAGDAGTTTAAAAGGGCTEVDAPQARPDGGQQRPKQELDPSATYDVTFATNCGELTVRLDVAGAPKTTASFAALVEDGFYDGTSFHRIVPGFVIQGGDPTGTGSGGPGYKTVDPPPADASYTRGVVAMAKTATEPPGTAGSQFYVVTGADAGLPPDYAIVGEVVEGMDVVQRIGRLGDASEQPTQPVVIERATLDES